MLWNECKFGVGVNNADTLFTPGKRGKVSVLEYFR